MKMRRFVIIVLVVPWLAAAQTTIRIDSLYAPSIGMTRPFVLLLPSGYDAHQQYPILYLLHGYTGGYRDWIDRTGIENYCADLPFIVVMPDAGNSWYVNSATDSSQRYEDYIINDLRRHVESMVSVDTTRRAVAGLSMGGYGALVLAFRHPDLFRFAGSLSGALDVPDDIPDWEHHSWGQSVAPNLKKTFGARPGPFWQHHDLFRLFRTVPADSLPYCYMAAGTHDGFVRFLPAARALADSLRAYGAAYEYHETPGRHSWKFWDREIQPLLKQLADRFAQPN